MRYFISDMHFFHKNVLGFGQRGEFINLEEMHTHMINKWNSRVRYKDLVYIIGDFSFGNYEDTKGILNQLKGRKILIRGNHDSRFTSKEFIEMGFEDVRDEMHIKLGENKVLLKHYGYHYPIKNFFRRLFKQNKYRSQPTYRMFFPYDRGYWHIHGHHHGGKLLNGRQINVSAETLNYIPIDETDIIKLMAPKESKWRLKNVFNVKK